MSALETPNLGIKTEGENDNVKKGYRHSSMQICTAHTVLIPSMIGGNTK